MAGKTPHAAAQSFLQPLQLALSCVSDAVLDNRGGNYASEKAHVVTLAGGDPVPLRSEMSLSLRATVQYRLITDEPPRGPWRASTAAYGYSYELEDGTELLAYHWHPQVETSEQSPHLHAGFARDQSWHKIHLPTGRVALEEIIRLGIRDLGVEPRREDWAEVLDMTQGNFESWRTWPAPMPSQAR